MSESPNTPTANSIPPLIQIYTFGTLQVVRDQQIVTESDWHTRQARQLLKILITERPRPVATDRLIDLIWPNSTPDAASTTLRSAINALRNVLEPERPSRAPSKYIITKTPGYAFQNHADIWLDVDHFEQLLKQAEHANTPVEQQQRLEAAIELYQDDYLTSDPYADWAQSEREQLRERYFAALLTVATLRANQGNFTAAIAACRRIIARDPVRENAYQAMMRYQAESGDSASALLTYERCRAILAEELGADPSPLTQAWHAQILNGEIGPQQIESYQATQPSTDPALSASLTSRTELKLPPQPLNLVSERRGDGDGDERARYFVGRVAELALLATRLRQAQMGNGSLLFLEGEAGVGKSHLVFHFMQQVAGPTLTVIHTTCQPLEQQLPFAALSDGLSRYLHTLSDPLLRTLPAASMAQLAQLIPSIQDRLPALPVPLIERVAHSDENRQRLINGLIALLTTLAEARPLLFFIDDAQWADAETLALLGRLAQRLTQMPLFLLIAFRSGEVVENQALETLLHTLRRTDPLFVHHIQRFDRNEVNDLIAAILGIAPRLAEQGLQSVVELLFAATHGNPLLLTEALRALQERNAGVLDASWKALLAMATESAEEESESPFDRLGLVQNPRIQEIILERLRRLPPAARNLLHLCAVIGRDFSLDLLERLAGADPADDLVTNLEILLQRNFLIERADERIDFSHQIAREVAYDHMSVLQRRRLHLRVAEALATSRRAIEIPGEIAFHYQQAGSSANRLVAHYSVLAGERLLHSYGFHQAVDCFTAALALLDGADQETLAWKERALLGLGLAYESLFEPSGVTATYRQLQHLARAQGDRRLLLTAYSHQTSMLGLLGQQRESNELLLELLDTFASAAMNDGGQSIAEGATVMRDLLRRRQAIYRPEALSGSEHWTAYQPPPPAIPDAVQTILATLEPVHAVLPLFDYGWALLVQGQLPAAVACLEAVVQLARQTDQPSIAGTTYHLLAVAARMGGDLKQCYQLNEESLAMNRRLQGRAGELVSLWPRIGSGFAALQLGNIEEAKRRFQRVVEYIADLEAFRNHYNSATIGLGLVALAQGEEDKAQQLLEAAIGDQGNLYPYTHTQALLGLAQIADRRQDDASCRAYLQRALAFAGERSLLEEYSEALLAIVRLMPTAAPIAVLLSDTLGYAEQLGLAALAERLEAAQHG